MSAPRTAALQVAPARPRARRQLIPFHRLSVGPREADAARRAVLAGHLGGNEAATAQLEAALARLTGACAALFVTSCTHAMELALMALDIGPGDEVILPSFTFSSTATCILRQGARPVFAEIDPETWMLDPNDVARVAGPKTRAMLPVHYGGSLARMDALRAAVPGRCAMVEDAAHAFGARAGGRAAGTLGDAGAYSFHATKNLTCGEGGAVVFRDAEISRRAEWIREKGTNRAEFLRQEVDFYTWVSPGSSFVASDVLAAILLEQLERLEAITAARRAIWQRYHEALAPLASKGWLTLQTIDAGVESNCHVFGLLVAPEHRDALRGYLLDQGIETRSHYVPLHAAPYWQQATGGRQRPLPVTDRISASLLRLPIYPDLTPRQQQRVIDQILLWFRSGR